MKTSFLKKYIFTYLWQSAAYILTFVSMFIVTPMLSSNPVIYGIYMLCVSTTIFLSYADLGFMGAGYKYASESYARGETGEILRISGFVSLILLVFSLLFSLVALLFSFNPGWIIAGIEDGLQRETASKLFLVLAVSSPVIVLQRGLQILFGARVEEYLLQSVVIIGNALRIASVFFFFRHGKYDIVGYFFFCQVVSAVCALVNLFLAKSRYRFTLREYLQSIRFSRPVYEQMRSLAVSSFLSMVTWILFYELDPFAVSRLLGAERLAIYSIGLSIMAIIRNLYGILYNPFSARFNHFIGLGDEAGLKALYVKVIEFSLPVVSLPLVALMFYLEPFILSWVGPQYSTAVPIVRTLLVCYVPAFTWYTAGILLSAKKRVREINMISTASVLLFWGCVYTLLQSKGLMAFAISKVAVFLSVGLYYLFVTMRFLGTEREIVVKALLRIVPSVLVVIILGNMILPLLPVSKGRSQVAIVVLAIGMTSVVSMVLYGMLTPGIRNFVTGDVMKRLKGLVRSR